MAHENVHRFRFGSWACVISLNLTYERKFQSDSNNNNKKKKHFVNFSTILLLRKLYYPFIVYYYIFMCLTTRISSHHKLQIGTGCVFGVHFVNRQSSPVAVIL